MSSGYVKTNISEAEDLAPGFGLQAMGEARFLRDKVGAETIGMAHYRMNPGQRPGFGHKHKTNEEIYVVLAGSGRMKVEDDIFDLAPHDVVFVRPEAMREWESGPDGLELIAFGAHSPDDGEMHPGWWTD
jgi:mannose-6-phosphate isomerase-like protein (cupin superfamily)